MNKIFMIAVREFLATAATKAFIFGILAIPAMLGIVILLGSLGLFNSENPKAEGTILILDRTDSAFVAQGLEEHYSEESIQAQRDALSEQMGEALDKVPIGNDEQKEMAMDAAISQLVPSVTVERLALDTDLDAQKSRLKDSEDDAFLLFIVSETSVEIPPSKSELTQLPEAEQDAAQARGMFEIYQNKDVRAQIVGGVQKIVRKSLVEERIRREGLDPARIEALNRFPTVEAKTLTDSGETDSSSEFVQFLPLAFFMLIYMSVMFGGQYLLMSTIEEKSTRVMEVLLSAISPTQLLIGKIIGQGAVGIFILLVYGGMGLVAADQFGVLALIPARLIPWTIFYFFIAYAFFASLMAAAGSAVSDIREASSLTSPIMMLMMIPFFLWMPISQNPEGIIATVTSFIPPLTPFIMVLRMFQPGVQIPMWEMIATTAVALLGVAFMVYAAIKIFRVGVLMYGKPPSFLGLLKWIRYA